MLIQFRHPAGQFTLFSPEAAESLIGQKFVAKHEDKPVGEGHVVDAKVVEHGLAIDFTIDWPDEYPITDMKIFL